MADMILKINEKDAVEETNVFLKPLTEDQRHDFFILIQGYQAGVQAGLRIAAGGSGVQDTA